MPAKKAEVTQAEKDAQAAVKDAAKAEEAAAKEAEKTAAASAKAQEKGAPHPDTPSGLGLQAAEGKTGEKASEAYQEAKKAARWG